MEGKDSKTQAGKVGILSGRESGPVDARKLQPSNTGKGFCLN